MRPSPTQLIVYCVLPILAPLLYSTAQVAPNPSPSTAKTAEQVYKNVQVLKGVPADQLIPAMQFVTASLGVQCDFCHVENAFEKDDKEAKQTARKMIQMMFTINKENFSSERKVTCYACHRGARKPLVTPVVDDQNTLRPEVESPPQQAPAADLPTIDHILERYSQAIGGPEASGKISTRIQHGTLSVGAKSFPVDVLSEAPDSRLTIVHFADGDHVSAVNAAGGWSSTPGHPVRNMGMTELQDARSEAELFFASNLRTIFGELKVVGKDRINGKEMFLGTGSRANSPPVQIYFNAESGLIQRIVYYTETPLGANTTQVDYADYREQDGVKTPLQWTVSRPNRRFMIRIEKTQQNVPIDDSRLRSNPSGLSH